MCPAEEPEDGGGSAGPAPEPAAPDPPAAAGTPSADAAAEEIRKLRAQLAEERATRLRVEETMQALADEDGLTGVAGARRLDDRLALALVHARRQKHKLALVQLSLDGFQSTVERLGRADADELLRCVAYALQTTLRQGDTIARLSSSDVFTIVLPGIDRDEDVTVIAEKLRLCLRTPFSIGGSSLFVTASLGIAVFPEDGSDPESLLQGAAHAMSRAQEKGGDAWDVHAPGSRARAVRRLTRETTLRRALVGDSLALYWRPALLCATGALVGMEALLRWHGERSRAAAPEDFVSPRDVPNLAVPLGQWLFRRACREAARWPRSAGQLIGIHVGISGRQIAHGAFVDLVRRVLDESGLPPGALQLGMSSRELLGASPAGRDRLLALRRLGIRLALQFFGTSESRIVDPYSFSVDALGIDYSVVGDALRNPEHEAIVTAAVVLGHARGLRIVADGVDTDDHARLLARLGCDEMQGRFCGEPMAAADVEPWLASRAGAPASAPAASVSPAQSASAAASGVPDPEHGDGESGSGDFHGGSG